MGVVRFIVRVFKILLVRLLRVTRVVRGREVRVVRQATRDGEVGYFNAVNVRHGGRHGHRHRCCAAPSRGPLRNGAGIQRGQRTRDRVNLDHGIRARSTMARTRSRQQRGVVNASNANARRGHVGGTVLRARDPIRAAVRNMQSLYRRVRV